MTVVILAGGKSKRLGTDKALLEWQGKPLLLQLVERFKRAGFSVIVAGGPSEWAQRLQGMPAPIVADLPAHEGFGPLAGIEAGFLSIKTQSPVPRPASLVPFIGVVACDLPLADPNLLYWLAEKMAMPMLLCPSLTASHSLCTLSMPVPVCLTWWLNLKAKTSR
jgi:Molybdopterin-guanine dinucleotide biosynthesis protein A